MALVSNTSINDNVRNYILGLTTNYMSRLKLYLEALETKNQSPSLLRILSPRYLYAYIQCSWFKLPLNTITPLVLITSGIGITPFHAFLAEHTCLCYMNLLIGQCILFYSVYNASSKFLYIDKIAKVVYEQGIVLVEIVMVFSQDLVKAQDHLATSKWYVQDHMRERFGHVGKLLLKENASLYVYRSAAIGYKVARVMEQCFERDIGQTNMYYKEQAAQIKRTQKWQEDVWGQNNSVRRSSKFTKPPKWHRPCYGYQTALPKAIFLTPCIFSIQCTLLFFKRRCEYLTLLAYYLLHIFQKIQHHLPFL